jgi:hypothetical protein
MSVPDPIDQHQNVTQATEELLKKIDESAGTDDEKTAAKSKVFGLLKGLIKDVAEGGPRTLVDRLTG